MLVISKREIEICAPRCDPDSNFSNSTAVDVDLPVEASIVKARGAESS
jgi:hypothetical protein